MRTEEEYVDKNDPGIIILIIYEFLRVILFLQGSWLILKGTEGTE